MNASGSATVLRLLALQAALCLVFALGWTIVHVSIATAWLVLVGGLAAMLITLISGLRTFIGHHSDAQTQAGAFYRGQAFKWALSVLFFIAVTKFVPQHFLALLTGFVSGFLSFWLILLWKS
jgi:F0F1-type ATP synthase assembly protein I